MVSQRPKTINVVVRMAALVQNVINDKSMTKYITRKYVRQTSIDAYHEMESKGLLTGRRWEIYDIVFNHGPMTATEVFQQLGLKTNQSGRFTELRDMGVLCEVQVRKCSVTGMKVIEWDVTPNLPRAIPKKKNLTKNQKEDLMKQKKDLILKKIAVLGNKDLPVDVEDYKNGLREIYVEIQKL